MRTSSTFRAGVQAMGWRAVAPTGLVAVLALLAALLMAAAPASAETPHPSRLFWAVPGDSVTLGNGWTLTTTNSPFIEVNDERGTLLGHVELLNFALDDELAAAGSEGRLWQELRARVREHHRVIAEDREALENGRYDYRPGTTSRTRFGDTLAIRYHSTTVDTRTGKVVERVRGYMAVSANQFWVLGVNGLDPSFLASDLMDLTPEQVQAVSRHLGGVVKASPLPNLGTAVADGIVVGTDGGLDGGRLYHLWQGEKVRIAQPRPLSERDVRELGLERGERIATLALASRQTGSWFAVVPADGPDARLHVVIGDRIHEVAVQALRREPLVAFTDAERSWLDRLSLAGS